ncbi:acyltransferase [Hymenobacter sediminis]|uniref:acyltransferase family protein n=1 Tax=Hymenobacter sediminis TaxID=2218621 RepID=UPI000DA680E7|nr:acyltransferase [Hymenobacter sediminis]RPD48297.1 acyltransferase [Hymenobacter sediminis]
MPTLSTNSTLQKGVEKASANKPYFGNLDFLRVVAFVMVFGLHTKLTATLGLLSSNTYYQLLLGTVFDGALGVSFFFALSGFLITYLLLGEVASTGRVALRNFYMRRFLRIWPLYYVVLVFGFWLYPEIKMLLGMDFIVANQGPWYWSFLSNFDSIYLHHHGLQDKSVSFLNITWSVAIEEQFYLLWPLLFVLVPRRHYPVAMGLVILTSTGFRFLHRTDHATLYFHTLSVASDLAMGGLASWYCLHSSQFLTTIKRLPKALIIGVYVLGFAHLVFRDTLYNTPDTVAFSRLVHCVFFLFIILEQNFAENSPVKLSRFRLVSRVGKYTYGLYLLHPIAIQITDLTMRLGAISSAFLSGLIYVVSAALLSFLLAYCSYHYLEAPFLKLKHRFSS